MRTYMLTILYELPSILTTVLSRIVHHPNLWIWKCLSKTYFSFVNFKFNLRKPWHFVDKFVPRYNSFWNRQFYFNICDYRLLFLKKIYYVNEQFMANWQIFYNHTINFLFFRCGVFLFCLYIRTISMITQPQVSSKMWHKIK